MGYNLCYVLYTNAVCDVSACGLTGSDNLHHLVLAQSVVAGHRVKHLDARQLRRIQAVALQQLHLLLVCQHLDKGQTIEWLWYCQNQNLY